VDRPDGDAHERALDQLLEKKEILSLLPIARLVRLCHKRSMTNANETPEAVYALIQAAETAGKSDRSINKLWKRYFAAEDARKLNSGARAWAR
jgi:hypothetical protein